MSETKPQAPLIGENFSGPRDNAPRKSLQRKDDSETAAKIEAAGSEDEPLSGKDKAQAYRDALEKAGITVIKAREILDAVVFKDCYQEDLALLGKRLKVGIRTRVYDDMQRIMKALESEAPAFPVHTDDLVARYNVAASLAYYQDTRFEFPDPQTATFNEVEEAFNLRMKFLIGLPTPVISRLITAVNEFDSIITAVFAEGAPEDF